MSFSKPGIRGIAIAGVNSLLSSPSFPIAFGLRQPANLSFKGHEEISDYRDRKLRNMINAKLEASTYQGMTNEGNITVLQNISHFVNAGGCDCQLIGIESVLTNNKYIGDVYNFCGNTAFMGLGYDFTLSPKGRDLKIPLEVALPFDVMKALIASAGTNESCSFLNTNGATHGFAGIDYSKYSAPYLTSIEAPSGTTLFPISEMDDWSISFKTKSDKAKLTNRDKVSYVTVKVELTTGNASQSEILKVLNKSQEVQLVLRVSMGSISEVYQFNSGVLTHSDEFELADKTRQSKISFSADIPFPDFHTALTNAISNNQLILNL